MIKVIPPGSYDFDGPPVRLLKVARAGLGPNDRREMRKFASESFVEKLARMELGPGDEPALNLALSTTEAAGPNRNGDGFRAEWCRRNHGTFVKHARCFRNHDNKPRSPSYGLVKLSHFNERMQRVELGLVYNGTKEAAARNGGEVADLEMEKLARGEPFDSSMACFVRHDVCSSCGNRARTRAEYCTPGMCKHGGLRDNIGRVFADGHHLHADNPDPDWFDISHIVGGRGADRTSFTLGRVKAAAAGVASGAELAEGLGLSTPFLPGRFGPGTAGAAKLAAELAAGAGAAEAALAAAFGPLAAAPVPPPPGGAAKAASALRALADRGVVLPVRDFLALASGDPALAAAAAPHVARGVKAAYSRLLEGGDAAFAANPFAPGPTADREHREWAEKAAASASLDREAVRRRAVRAAVREASGATPPAPAGGAAPPAACARLAEAYALYKTAALAAMPPAERAARMAAARAQDLAAT